MAIHSSNKFTPLDHDHELMTTITKKGSDVLAYLLPKLRILSNYTYLPKDQVGRSAT